MAATGPTNGARIKLSCSSERQLEQLLEAARGVMPVRGGNILRLSDTYWDTADSYGGGENEEAIGAYFERYPEDRKKVFLVTKTSATDPKKLSKNLNQSLRNMNTSYVDLYFIHHVDDVRKDLTRDVKLWAQKAKAKGKIKFFGFSAHSNMEENSGARSFIYCQCARQTGHRL